MQIFGSSSANNSGEDEESKKGDRQLGLDKQNKLSTSPVVVSSRDDVPNLLKK